MRKILIMGAMIAALAPAGCNGCKELRARLGGAIRQRRPQPSPVQPAPTATQQNFLGLDLTAAPRSTRPSDLPDLWEEVPPGSLSFEMLEAVQCVYSGVDGSVFYIPGKKRFYIQHDPPSSSTLTYYGPFEGDPREILDVGIDEWIDPPDRL
jgi:hypothetical protein